MTPSCPVFSPTPKSVYTVAFHSAWQALGTTTEPDASPWLRFKQWLLTPFVPESLL